MTKKKPEARVPKKLYEAELKRLQIELVEMQQWVIATGRRVLVLFEGRDAAGKGGAIKRIMQYLNPRHARIVALPQPSERERGQWYFQRYIEHLPAAGEIVLLDRSWYNRAGVEKVMGYATDAQVRAFLAQVPVFERQLVDDGILLFKYWLCCDQAQQEKRFAERREDPLKGWKLSPVDLKARELYAAYTEAREAMLEATHTAHAPWTLVDFNDQRRGRLTVIRDLLDRLPDTRIDDPPPDLPPLAGKPLKERYGTLKPIAPFPVD
jgi:polyphosphate kinase 2